MSRDVLRGGVLLTLAVAWVVLWYLGTVAAPLAIAMIGICAALGAHALLADRRRKRR